MPCPVGWPTGVEGILVERPMYFHYTVAVAVSEGHNVMGATAARTQWFFAEGYTGAGFQEYLVILNPSASATQAVMSFQTTGGLPTPGTVNLPAFGRAIVNVNDPVAGVGPNWPVSVEVEAIGSSGIVVERHMAFAYTGSAGAVNGAHTVMGFAPVVPVFLNWAAMNGSGLGCRATCQGSRGRAATGLVGPCTNGPYRMAGGAADGENGAAAGRLGRARRVRSRSMTAWSWCAAAQMALADAAFRPYNRPRRAFGRVVRALTSANGGRRKQGLDGISAGSGGGQWQRGR